jgi:maltose alpha-D-glucosyltransferase/alpha-amylase
MKPDTPDRDLLWYKDAVLYEVHVKSFFDSSRDGLGDFPGLTQKLDYLQELGITCIWLQPFYPSPLRDNGYDISDFRGVHPAYGTMEDFRKFLREAHQRGLRVIPELVLSHTSDQHPWFQAARKAPPGSAPRNFYVWSDHESKGQNENRGSNRKVAENTARSSTLDPRSSKYWTWDPVAQASYRHRFFEHQPDLNLDQPAVRQEIVRIMKFWLDLGVDGLCVNVWPYQAEEDSLHAVLKEIRREMNGRMPLPILLAAINRWPSEVRPYFGDGDECHLALHFSLLPRLFMALRQEDRHPITEIVRQTPAIPDKCQWALFLRNHDELSLALVSDEERDYMYEQYAADPQMRMTLGIRRRLAPLLENSRPRIELMNSLLFSLPGTPVIYYGDEIGMGDNVYLGDRQGVRTPMQWSGDRNAGFSEADFAQLYSPPIIDPVFGYPAVNVEAQRRDPSSLLHWMRRLIALHKKLPALSGGNLEFLHPANRKVLAYARHFGDDVILVVANLSRVVQPVELDLSAFADMVPVEVFGQAQFPRIGNTPYFFTLAPYGFYWFRLQRTVEQIAVRFVPVPTEEYRDVPLLEVAGNWEDLLESPSREALAQVIPRFLLAQRWFGGKARAVESVRIVDWTILPAKPTRVFWTFLEVAFQDGARDLYSLPLAVVTGSDIAGRLPALRGRMLAHLSGAQGDALLIDAMADESACEAILSAIAGRRELPTPTGVIRASPTTAFAELRGSEETTLKVNPGPATSSNSLVFFGRRLLLKLFRRLQAGINPDLEIGRFLTEMTDFEAIPKTAGFMEFRQPLTSGARRGSPDPADSPGRGSPLTPERPAVALGAGSGDPRTAGDGMTSPEPVSLAILQQLVSNQGDGWRHAIDELERYYERASVRLPGPETIATERSSWLELVDSDPLPSALEAIGFYLQVAATLGKRTAELHLALASNNDDLAFAPEPMTTADLSELAAEARGQARKALTALQQSRQRLPEALQPPAGRVLDEGPDLLDRLSKLPAAKLNTAKIRCHGDYHLGQVLRVESDFVILDFEGEPAHTMEQRRAKQSPLKDVAGMLRSFNYAAYAGLFAFIHHRPENPERLIPWAELWQRWTSAVFLKEYRSIAGNAIFLPADSDQFSTLLEFFILDKAFYELIYELNNRPDWVRIPLAGILSFCSQSGRMHPAPRS